MLRNIFAFGILVLLCQLLHHTIATGVHAPMCVMYVQAVNTGLVV